MSPRKSRVTVPDRRIASPDKALAAARELAVHADRFPAKALPDLEADAQVSALLALEVVEADRCRVEVLGILDSVLANLPMVDRPVPPPLKRARAAAGIPGGLDIHFGGAEAFVPHEVRMRLRSYRYVLQDFEDQFRSVEADLGAKPQVHTIFVADLLLRLEVRGLPRPAARVLGLMAYWVGLIDFGKRHLSLNAMTNEWDQIVRRAEGYAEAAKDAARLRLKVQGTPPLQESQAELMREFLKIRPKRHGPAEGMAPPSGPHHPASTG